MGAALCIRWISKGNPTNLLSGHFEGQVCNVIRVIVAWDRDTGKMLLRNTLREAEADVSYTQDYHFAESTYM